MIYEFDSLNYYRYKPNSTGLISKPSIQKTVVINNEGYYGPAFSKEKLAGKFRIIVVGTSNAGGIWLHGSKSFPIVLQEIFNRHSQNVEVITCAIDGINRNWETIKAIRSKIVQYAPDLILLEGNFPLNFDHRTRECYRGYLMEYSTDSRQTRQYCIDRIDALNTTLKPLTWLYDISYTMRAACKYVIDRPESFQGEYVEYARIYREKNVASAMLYYTLSHKREMKEIADLNLALTEQAIKLIFLNYHEPVFEDELRALSIPTITLDIPEADSLAHEHDAHFNASAHQLIAERLYLKLESFIPNKIKQL
jgi:hypothetical protein